MQALASIDSAHEDKKPFGMNFKKFLFAGWAASNTALWSAIAIHVIDAEVASTQVVQNFTMWGMAGTLLFTLGMVANDTLRHAKDKELLGKEVAKCYIDYYYDKKAIEPSKDFEDAIKWMLQLKNKSEILEKLDADLKSIKSYSNFKAAVKNNIDAYFTLPQELAEKLTPPALAIVKDVFANEIPVYYQNDIKKLIKNHNNIVQAENEIEKIHARVKI